MHKLKSEYIIPHPRINVFKAMRDRYDDYWRDLPNIEKFEVKEEKDLGKGKRKIVIEWTGKAPIPKILQHLLAPKMLKWLDTGVWDEDDFSLIWESKTYYYKDIFKCGGKWEIKEIAKNKTQVLLNGLINIKMPIFGAIAEIIVARYLLANLKKAEKNLREMLKREK